MQTALLIVDEVESNKRALQDLKLIPWQIQVEWQICGFGILTWEGED